MHQTYPFLNYLLHLTLADARGHRNDHARCEPGQASPSRAAKVNHSPVNAGSAASERYHELWDIP